MNHVKIAGQGNYGEPTESDSVLRPPTTDWNIRRSAAHQPTLTDAKIRLFHHS
jgi:hypothetical protein